MYPMISNNKIAACHNNIRYTGGNHVICTRLDCNIHSQCLFSKEEVQIVRDIILKR